MARQKSRKTALKRLRKTNPKGNRKGKLIYNQSAQHHLRSKLSRKSKRRKSTRKVVTTSVEKKIKKLISV